MKKCTTKKKTKTMIGIQRFLFPSNSKYPPDVLNIILHTHLNTDNMKNQENTLKQNLIEVLSIQSYSYQNWRMFAYLIRQAKSNGWDYFVNNGNIYIEKSSDDYWSDTVPCIVAHMDTVHKITSDLSIYETSYGELFGFNEQLVRPTGIGGDDKVGIFLALECLRKYDNIKVAFFRDEEVGCVGSALAVVEFFSNCSFILQGDRNGNADFVIDAAGTELSSTSWQEAIQPTIKKYGYDFNYGSVTDVMQLKELGIECVMANVSCGYYNPHTENEFVNIYDVMNCLEMFFALIDGFGEVQYTHRHTTRSWRYGKSYDTQKDIGDWRYDDELRTWVQDTIGDTGSGFEYDGREDEYPVESYKELCLDCYSREAKASGVCEACEAYYVEQYGASFESSDDFKSLKESHLSHF